MTCKTVIEIDRGIAFDDCYKLSQPTQQKGLSIIVAAAAIQIKHMSLTDPTISAIISVIEPSTGWAGGEHAGVGENATVTWRRCSHNQNFERFLVR
jgi:hypothetical protein